MTAREDCPCTELSKWYLIPLEFTFKGYTGIIHYLNTGIKENTKARWLQQSYHTPNPQGLVMRYDDTLKLLYKMQNASEKIFAHV